MKKACIFLSAIIFTACTAEEVDGLVIDPSIREEVERRTGNPADFGPMEGMLIYQNSIIADLYENDELTASINASDNRKDLFKSWYFWHNDTLWIEGGFGMFTGIGFTLKIENNKATLFHMVSTDDMPAYGYGETDSLRYRLEVPCTETKIILSEIPDSVTRPVIYGYVEFKSKDYYFCRFGGDHTASREKQRAEMKIYFRSGYIEW
jgi:hypothetical protein